MNIATTPYNLHLSLLTTTLCESGGVPVSMVTTDFDGDTRCPNGGCPGSKSAPDVGADEFNGTGSPTDVLPPTISYLPLGMAPVGTSRTLPNVTITDASGINILTGTKPRLYFKKSTDANDATGWKYVETSGTTSPFSFTMNYSLLNAGTVSAGDYDPVFRRGAGQCRDTERRHQRGRLCRDAVLRCVEFQRISDRVFFLEILYHGQHVLRNLHSRHGRFLYDVAGILYCIKRRPRHVQRDGKYRRGLQ